MNANMYIEMQKLQGYRTSHILHLLLSVLTMGVWVPVWALVALSNALERGKIERKIRKMEV